MESKFQKWIIDNQPEDKMLWKNALEEECLFWRDRIIPMFNTVKRSYEDYEKTAEDIDAFTDVVGSHFSKSIRNPVLKLTYKDTIIVFRYNFYDYEIAVIGNKEVNLPMKGLFSSQKDSFFFQGFPKEYQLAERYESNKCKFMASLGSHYQFFTFMFLLKTEIDSNGEQSNKMAELRDCLVDAFPNAFVSHFSVDMMDNILAESEKIESISERCEWLAKIIPEVTLSEISGILLQ